MSIKNDIKNSTATLMVAYFVADFISNGFFITAIIPMASGINEKNTSTPKSKFEGYKLVKGIRMKEMVANNPQVMLSLKANSRPFNTIHVILFPNLSPSIVGISKLLINIICKKITGMVKIKKGRSRVPFNTK